MTENMETVSVAYEDLKLAMFIALDEGAGNGMTNEELLSEMKAFVASTELGPMDNMVEEIFAEWLEDRIAV